MKPNWEFIQKIDKYSFWKYTDADGRTVYNQTDTDEPPTNEAGYYSLVYLLKVKNVYNPVTMGDLLK